MRTHFALPFAALALLSCGGGDEKGEAIGNPTPDELAARIENVAQVKPEAEKAVPQRLGPLDMAALPEDYRTGPACRLTAGTQLLLVAGPRGAAATIDGKPTMFPTAGPVGPSGGFWEAPGVTVSIGLKPPAGAVPGSPVTRAGVTIGGAKDKPIERHEATWACG
jgi:hypothetical protein